MAKVALITGASKEIGFSIAENFCSSRSKSCALQSRKQRGMEKWLKFEIKRYELRALPAT